MRGLLRIATRGSRLARNQTQRVARALEQKHPGLRCESVIVRTTGDRDRTTDLAQMSRTRGIGFFVREVEQALLDGRADLAVHSLKDLPTEEGEELLLAAVPRREDPRDAIAPGTDALRSSGLEALPEGAVVGTGSPRRRAQLLRHRPDLEVRPLRGNVPTRLGKAGPGGDYDAVVLAAAGLRRLGLEEEAAPLPLEVLLPAPGQGALGLQCRSEDEETRILLEAIEDPDSRDAVTAERAFLRRLQGGCALPAGAFAETLAGGDTVRLRAMVLSLDGRRVLEEDRSGPRAEADALGLEIAEELLRRGADDLLQEA